MSQANVELVRRWYASVPDLRHAESQGDRALLDQMFHDYLDGRYELHLPAGYPEGEPVFRGREGAVALPTMLRDAWSEWRFEPERFLDAGDQVVVFVLVVAIGRTSGVPIKLPDAHVVTVRDGRMTSTQVYRDRAEALKAVGLEEEAMSQANVEIVRLGFEALNAGEPDFSIFHPELVYHPRTDEPDPYAHAGREAFERLLLGFVESFRELQFDVVELIDAGDRVIASTVMRGRGSASGVAVNDAYVFVYQLRDGLVVEGWEYRTRQEALEAMGLE